LFCIFAPKTKYEKVNLIVEQGNTMLKLAVFDGDRMVICTQQTDSDPSGIRELIEQHQPDKGIMSSVAGDNKKLTKTLKTELSYFLWLDETALVPVSIEYKTVNTLGKDRIAAVVGANYLQPGQHLLVIDAGTAITYELIEASGVYKGGNISPGLTTRFRSLNRFTKQLPLVKEQANVPFIGTDTESAIMAGVVNGIVFEMDGYIDALKAKYEDFFVYLTGGHSFYFEKRLKNHIFAEPNLVLVGLNRILEYNAKKN
jgi:type III pantothenate kinase